MTTITDPIIGSWYKDVENNLKFKVVAIEENDLRIFDENQESFNQWRVPEW